MNITETLQAARRAGVPIIAISTPDPAETVRTVGLAVNSRKPGPPVLTWDIVRGFRGVNVQPGDLASMLGGAEPGTVTNPVEALVLAANLPGNVPSPDNTDSTVPLTGSVLCVFMANRYLSGPGSDAYIQAVWVLRDAYKRDGRTLVLIGSAFSLPPELAQDVVVLSEELPGDERVSTIVQKQVKAAGLPELPSESISRAVDALRGLPAFAAEQLTAMSLRKSGVDLPSMWDRKRSQIEQTKGLSVDRGRETFADIGGLAQVKAFLGSLCAGSKPPRLVVRIEEIEKLLAGSGAAGGPGDTSGVSQDALAVILGEMEDREYTGLIAVGPPGSGKSLISKALGNTHGVMSLTLDLGGLRGSLVGESEAAVRDALRVVRSVAGDGGALWVATCNGLQSLPPELRRRFKLGIWFFDLPSREERDPIWSICLKRYGLPLDSPRPADNGWTGADIRNVCEVAWRLRVPLTEAAGYIVPVSKSDPESIERLRKTAAGRFLSASYPGPYSMPVPGTETGARRVEVV